MPRNVTRSKTNCFDNDVWEMCNAGGREFDGFNDVQQVLKVSIDSFKDSLDSVFF